MLSNIFHTKPSDGAVALKNALKIKKIKLESSKFKGKPEKTVINWGSTQLTPEVLKCNILNKPSAIQVTSNKLSFFKTVAASKYPEIIPPFTEDMEQVVSWLKEGYEVICRTILNGSGGAGIIVIDRDTENLSIPNAPLYVRYVPKTEEYRVHVVKDIIIDTQRKTLSTKTEIPKTEINWKIRNLENGFIYQRNNINPHESVFDVAKKAIEVSGLDFGAVDIVFGKKDSKAYVLEINTAPGLQGTTVENYAKAFKELF